MSERRLYGVHHGSETRDIISGTHVHPVHPSNELISYLKSLPAGTMVGVEASEELFPVNPSQEESVEITMLYHSVGTSRDADRYWADLISVCRNVGLRVEFLDDFSLFQSYYQKFQEAYRLKQIRNGRLRYGMSPGEKVLSGRDLDEAIFKAFANASYTHVFEREKAIFANAIAKKPRVLIMGIGHAGPLFFGTETLEQAGLKVDMYFEEDPRRQNGEKVQQVTEGMSRSLGVERDRILRRYNAANNWKVFPGLDSDFIGTFDLSCRTAGLFEIVLSKNGELRGWVHDCAGSGFVTGEEQNGKIVFIKQYDRDWIDVVEEDGTSAFAKPITYHGEFDGEKYKGSWHGQLESGGLAHGSFVMFKGNHFDKDAV